MEPINTTVGEGDPFYRHKRPRILVKWEGKQRTLLRNLKQVALELRRDEDLLLKWIGVSLGTQTFINRLFGGGVSHYLRGNWTSDSIEEAIRKFTRLCVICSLCGDPGTVLYAHKGMVRLSCTACGSDVIIRDKYMTRWLK